MLMTISLQVCLFTFGNPKKVLDQFTFTFFVKFQFQIVKLFKIILSVGHPLTPQKISESGNGTLCMQQQANLTHQIMVFHIL